MTKHYYYYGNSLKEALSNPPVEIKTLEQLLQYESTYAFVISAFFVEKNNKAPEEKKEENN